MKQLLSLLLSLSLLLVSGCGGGQQVVLPKEDAPSPIVSPQPDPIGDSPQAVPDGEADPSASGEPSSEPEPAPEPEPEPEPEEPYVRVIDPALPMVALTFDDGPHSEYTDAILDVLEEHHAVATFFEVGRNVRACPDPLPRMAELGCEIASHSNAHRDLSKLKRSDMLQDLDTADQAFIDAGVDAPTLVRPPYGAVNKTVKYDSGRAMITWTVDTLDWKVRDTEKVVDYVKGLEDLDGEIVLLHSIYETTADAVAELVPWLMEEGYQLVTVTELMAYYYGELPAPGCFYGYTYFATHGRTDTPLTLPSAQEEAPEDAAEDAAEADIPDDSVPEADVPPEGLAAEEPTQVGVSSSIRAEEPTQAAS